MASSIRLLSRRIPSLAQRCASRPIVLHSRLQPALRVAVRSSSSITSPQSHKFHTSVNEEASVSSSIPASSIFAPLDTFQRRHIGPASDDVTKMLAELKYDTLDAFVRDVLPPNILTARNLSVSPEHGYTESELLEKLKKIAQKNRSDIKSFIGCGYYGTRTPNVILRNILECPEWYTSYTPYQPEISQGM